MKSTTEITKLPRKFAWGSVVLGLTLSLAFYSAPTLAYEPFLITSPPEGSAIPQGIPFTILWTGGDPSWNVKVALVDVDQWSVVAVPATNMQNSGSLIWEFPSSFYGNPGPCGRTYQFYVESFNQPAWTYGPHFLVVCEIPIAIDIKPGSFPNSINPRSRGVIPVAILTTDTFDATSVDTSTVFFGPTGIEAAPVHAAIEDVNGDGRPDMILHFKTQATGIQCGDTSAFLTGQTFSRQPIEGSNSINTVGCK